MPRSRPAFAAFDIHYFTTRKGSSRLPGRCGMSDDRCRDFVNHPRVTHSLTNVPICLYFCGGEKGGHRLGACGWVTLRDGRVEVGSDHWSVRIAAAPLI